MIKRYECFTEWGGTNYDATLTDDGPWVSYEDHSDVIQRLLQHSATRERMNGQTIATLRAENDRLNGIHKGLSVGNGPGVPLKIAMDVRDRMEVAERERDEAEERARFNARLAEGLPELVRERDEAKDRVFRRDDFIIELQHEIESARDAAKGENALRLEAERERDEARASNEVKRNALAIATRRLEFGRIWGGMEWVYQPMRAEQRNRTLDEIYAALNAAREG